jgi:hypothetical protein
MDRGPGPSAQRRAEAARRPGAECLSTFPPRQLAAYAAAALIVLAMIVAGVF